MSRLPSTLPTVNLVNTNYRAFDTTNLCNTGNRNLSFTVSDTITNARLSKFDSLKGIDDIILTDNKVTISTLLRGLEDIRMKVRTWVDNLTQPVLMAA